LSQSDLLIRPRRDDDLEKTVSVLAAVHASDGYPELWPSNPSRWLTPATLIAAWVAERAGDLIGHTVLCTAYGNAAAELWSEGTGLAVEQLGVVAKLFVVTPSRRHRLGERLLETACEEAQRRGLQPVLDVLDRNRAAIGLYERLGWRRLGAVKTECHSELLHCYAAPSAGLDFLRG
jgi:GNAT superfamily N-acetyltransferase